MVQRVVNKETNTGLKSSIIIRNADFCCSKSHCPSQNTSAKVQTQSLTTKKSKPKESRPKEAKLANSKFSALPHFNEVVKPNCQEKKKYQKKKQDWKNSSLAIRVNTIENGNEKKKLTKSAIITWKKAILLEIGWNL